MGAAARVEVGQEAGQAGRPRRLWGVEELRCRFKEQWRGGESGPPHPRNPQEGAAQRSAQPGNPPFPPPHGALGCLCVSLFLLPSTSFQRPPLPLIPPFRAPPLSSLLLCLSPSFLSLPLWFPPGLSQSSPERTPGSPWLPQDPARTPGPRLPAPTPRPQAPHGPPTPGSPTDPRHPPH